MKVCSGCGETKPLDGFYRDTRKEGRHLSPCIECRQTAAAAKRGPSKLIARSGPQCVFRKCSNCKVYRQRSQFRSSAQCSDGLQSWCALCEAEYQEKMKYGMTYGQAVERFGNACNLCGSVERRLNIDHDHITGRVRGLLCSAHNTGIGLLGDTVDGLTAALAYLLKAELETVFVGGAEDKEARA